MKTITLLALGLMAISSVYAGADIDDLAQVLVVGTSAAPCADDDPAAECLSEYEGGDSNITIYWGIPSNCETTAVGYNATVCDVLSQVSSIKLKLCFSDHSKHLRPWRKQKDDVKKDKQCLIKIEDIDTTTQALTSATGSLASYTYEIKSHIGRATYYIRAFGLNADDDYLVFGDSDELSVFEQPTAGLNKGYFFVKGYDGLNDEIKAVVVVMSILAWLLLISYFVYEKLIMKQE